MAVQDLWVKSDGTPSSRHGRGKRYRVSVPGHPSKAFAAKRPAQIHEARLLAEGPRHARDDSTTVGELVGAWLAGKAHLSMKGRESCAQASKVVLPEWGDRPASSITRDELQTWLSAQSGSPSRIRKIAQCLSGSLAIAVSRGVLAENPAASLAQPRERARQHVYLAREQVAAIAAVIPGRVPGGPDVPGYYAPLVWLLATTGVRVGEALALRVGDVVRRPGGWRLRISSASKSGRAREVPVPASVVAMLDLGRDADALLFTTGGGRRIDLDHWRAGPWRSALARVGLQDVHIHDLRHTAASWAIAAGADVKVLQRMLGHASAAMTLDVYADLLDERLDEVGDRLDRMLTICTESVPRSAD